MSGYPVWNPSAFYTTGEVVSYNGGLWQALQLTSGDVPPSSPAFWTAVGGGGGGNVNGVSAGVGISITGSSSNPVVNQTLVGTAGTYAYPASITTDNTGRITAATAGAGAPVVSIAVGGGLDIVGPGSSPTINLTGVYQVAGGSRIGVITSPPELATVSYAPLAAPEHTESVAISSATATTLGAVFTVSATGMYAITYSCGFQSGSGPTPIEVDQSLGNYITCDINAIPSLVYVAPAIVAPPPTISAPPALAVFNNTPTTQFVNLAAGPSYQLRIRVVNTGSGMSFDPNTTIYFDVNGPL